MLRFFAHGAKRPRDPDANKFLKRVVSVLGSIGINISRIFEITMCIVKKMTLYY